MTQQRRQQLQHEDKRRERKRDEKFGPKQKKPGVTLSLSLFGLLYQNDNSFFVSSWNNSYKENKQCLDLKWRC